MRNHDDIERLMSHDGITPDVGVELERKIGMAIEKKRREVRRMRIAVVVAWSMLAGLVIAWGIVEAVAGRSVLSGAVGIIAQACLTVALFFTISWHLRNVSLRFIQMSDALTDIQNQLSEMARRGRAWLPLVVCL